MVKRHYVITMGTEVGVFYNHWTSIAHLVKNKSEAVWQRADSEEEAEELFQQARMNGNVRVLPSGPRQSPTNSSGSRTSSTQRSSSSSGSNTSNPQSTRYIISTPRIAGSHSEGHVRNNASHYVPPSNSREMNTGYGASPRSNGSVHDNGSGGAKKSKPLSRTYSEPSQQIYGSNSGGRQGHPISGSTVSVSQPRIVIMPSIASETRHSTDVRTAVVDSPPWLASYPDEEDEEAFMTPPLSPITSPVISSRLLGPSKSEPTSTFSVSMGLAADITGKPVSDGGNVKITVDYRSPKPTKPSVSFLSSPRVQGSLGVRADGNLKNGSGKQKQRDEQVFEASSPMTSRYIGSPRSQQSIIDLVNTVEKLVKDLRVHVVSPSVDTDEDGSRRDDVPQYPSNSKRSPAVNLSSAGRNEVANITSLRSTPSLQCQFSEAGPSNTEEFSQSVLFGQGIFSTAYKGGMPGETSACKHCKGTGYNLDGEASLLDRTGLSQPNLIPFHPHDVALDPRSPFSSSKKLGVPTRLAFAHLTCGMILIFLSPIFGRPSPMVSPQTMIERQSPVIVSSPRCK
ncbi:hypothetical protein AN958_07999 [Leucoagaricus sp. SymC.cos]|nr:hypothetical protein AN958_07999 [Leucoagaricus sp. SymC.cos]